MLTTKEKIDLIMRRFVHEDASFAEQKYFPEDVVTGKGKTVRKGTYFFPVRRGDCRHTPRHEKQKDCPTIQEVPFTDKDLLKHLKGEATFAPYQISKDGLVKWVCFDVDAYDASDEEIQRMVVEVARRIQKLLGPHHTLVEKSGSKGYHLWTFFEEPVKANVAFTFGHMVVNGLSLNETMNVEVYPKQQSNAVFGNTVKLPLGIHQKTGSRCFFVDSSFEAHSDQWNVLQNVRTIPTAWLDEHVRPAPVAERRETTEGGYQSYAPRCLVDILDHGAEEGIRDEAAFRLACYLRDKGLNQSYGELVLERWNTLNNPPLEPEELQIKIESGFGKPYPWRPCLVPGFDSHCVSSCPFFAKKVEKRWFKKDDSPIGKICKE